MLERSDVEHPMWRKKVDGTLLKDASTPIPKWVQEIWKIKEEFQNVTSKTDKDGAVNISFQGVDYSGQIVKVKSSTTEKYRLHFDRELSDSLCNIYLMSYMRAIEAELSATSSHRQIEQEISFWEFLDIEFDPLYNKFTFSSSFTVKPQFPNLFARLIESAPLKAIATDVIEKDTSRIHKQNWRPRIDYKTEIGAKNVVYMLLDSKSKLLYIGEAKDLRKRFNNGHPDIKNWDYYKYNVLPCELDSYRLAIERMIIRDMASLLENKQSIPNIIISDYKLANRKIDK